MWVDVSWCARVVQKPPVPDFTRGGRRGESHDWTLGPTGARGWVYGRKGQTSDARQILVTAVAKGSPADGVLREGDVILGVGDRLFDDDARLQFARAIMAAEQEGAGGVLRLIHWRDGQRRNVELKLAVMGTYSETAPYDCPKSKRIFELGCRAIARGKLDRVSIPNDLNALALLASGRKEYRPLVADYARKVAVFRAGSFQSWHYGYAALFLAEYALATRDPSVMAGLRRLAAEIAAGQSAVGTWGHRFARPSGNCNGYGAMNQPGIVLTLAMLVAREAGVKNPAVDRAIAKASGFLRWYVNKGAIPYGDHRPWPGHEDNGKCSGAAVLFDLLGDREAAAFYAKMSTAGYNERERGHTGNFFNMLWALPGVSRCGPLATGAYMKEQAWYYDLARGWDGRFAYQGSPVGEEEHGKYTNWDCTGAYLLAYALPLKSLCVTGRKPCSVPALSRGEVEEVIAAGRDYTPATARNCYDRRKTEQLLAGLSSWSPAVRKRSAQALGRREGDFVPTLLKMLASSDRETRYGACEALGCLGPRADVAAPQLRALLKAPDPWMQSLACQALTALGSEARKASVADLLRLAASSSPADPRRMAQRAACAALFSRYPGSRGPRSILADSLEGVDRKLLYPAIRSVLENDDGAARGSLARIYGQLTDRDLVALMPAVLKAIRDLAPSNEMFGDGIRLAGLDLVSRLHIREGMGLCVSVMELDRWGAGRRMPKCLEYLGRYGTHAKAVLPQLREMRRNLVRTERKRERSDRVKLLDKSLAEIEASTASPTVLNMKEFMAATSRLD
ncbi:MAG: acetylesterase [Planctomycetes bacterium SM23_25]|nr:MAG: acetylesterase [Planctomycetes bacterium SM23_25]